MDSILRIAFTTFALFLSAMFSVKGQDVAVIKYDQLQNRMDNTNDTIYFFNFWATWCHYCVEESADLQQFTGKYKAYNGKPVKFLYVSLDYKTDLKKKVVPYIAEHG